MPSTYPSRPGGFGCSSSPPVLDRTDPCFLPSGPPRRTRSPAAAIDRSPRFDNPAPSSPISHQCQSPAVPAFHAAELLAHVLHLQALDRLPVQVQFLGYIS